MDEKIKEIDDLELEQCPGCIGNKMLRGACPVCHGDGKVVVIKTKWYFWESRRKSAGPTRRY